MDNEECLECGGPAPLLGVLGRRIHFKCRDCGAQQSRRLEDGETAPDLDGEATHINEALGL